MKTIGETNYEQFAERYAAAVETKAHNAYYDRPATLSLLPVVHGLRVLDVGSGPGIYAEWLVEHGATVTGFDVTPKMVEIAQSRLGTRAHFFIANLLDPLTFADRTFDLVLCPLVLDSIEDWAPVFKEFFRVLKPNGLLVFSAGHPFGDFLFTQRRELTPGVYFDIERFQVHWGGFGDPKPLMTGYRRSMSAVLNPLVQAGFLLDTLLEPVPVEKFKEQEPEDYARLLKSPGFLCVRAKKPMA
jgi:ubiquinone/menaquinone biosynthesis C-methylase UbiE